MPPTTKPPHPPSGLSTPGCYAYELVDCDGEPCTREHYLSKGVLELVGKRFRVSGSDWTKDAPRPASPGTLYAPVLCERHNAAARPVDSAAITLYRAFDEYDRGVDGPDISVDGDMLERWPLKAAAGLVASEHALWKDGAPEPAPPIPLHLIQMLFDEIEIPDGCGLHLIANGSPLPESSALVQPLTYGEGHPQAGVVYGGACGFLGTPFISIVDPIPVPGRTVWRRPAGLIFGQRRIALTWRSGPSSDWVTRLTPRRRAP